MSTWFHYLTIISIVQHTDSLLAEVLNITSHNVTGDIAKLRQVTIADLRAIGVAVESITIDTIVKLSLQIGTCYGCGAIARWYL